VGSELHVGLPPGIGDAHWVCQKLPALREHLGVTRLVAHINEDPDHHTVHYLRLVPFIDEAVCDRSVPLDYTRELPDYPGPRWSTLEGSANIAGLDYMLCANAHLERGERIETWLPGLATTYSYPLTLSAEARAWAKSMMPSPTMLLYPSGMSANEWFHGHWWTATNWMQVIEGLNHLGITPILVGAPSSSDLEYRERLMQAAEYRLQVAGRAPAYLDLIGRTTHEQVMALIERCIAIAGLNSGLVIVSSALNVPTVMLWADRRFEANLPTPGRVTLHPAQAYSWLNHAQLERYRVKEFGNPLTTPESVVRALHDIAR
jgi:hypothetical protein